MMKVFATILFLSSTTAKATNYYISNAGSDAANGTTTGTSWQTVSKVNSSSFSAGDSILFKRGDIWSETLRPQSSGSIGNHIIFGAYGTGVKPTFTGLVDVTMSSIGGNLYTGTITGGAAYQNTVIINGAIRAKGRYPNTTFFYSNNAATTQYRLIATGLTGTPDYTGGEVCAVGYNWICDVVKINSQSVDTLNVSGFTYGVFAYRYFIQNHVSVLDLNYEWCIDSTTKLITVYSDAGMPVVQAGGTVDTLCVIDNKNYITLTGLNFNGTNNVGIMLDSTTGITIPNSTVNNIGGVNPLPLTMGGQGGAGIRGEHTEETVISNDSIMNCLNNGVMIIHCSATSKLIMDNNYILSSGRWAGMGNSGNGSYYGVTFSTGDSLQFTNNRMDSVGYVGVNFVSDSSYIYRNYISNFCMIKCDGSAIGGSHWDGGTGSGSVIRANICINGINQFARFISAGIYTDGLNGVIIDSNTISNCDYYSLFLGSSNRHTVTNNNIMDSVGFCFVQQDGNNIGGAGTSYYNNNVFYRKNTAWQCMWYSYNPALVDMDSNYYVSPVSETNKIRVGGGTYYSSVAAWSGLYGFDTNGHDTPGGITADAGVLHINPTDQDSTITFSGVNKIDAKGVLHESGITIPPFGSAILFMAEDQPAPSTNKITLGRSNLIFTQ